MFMSVLLYKSLEDAKMLYQLCSALPWAVASLSFLLKWAQLTIL